MLLAEDIYIQTKVIVNVKTWNLFNKTTQSNKLTQDILLIDVEYNGICGTSTKLMKIETLREFLLQQQKNTEYQCIVYLFIFTFAVTK